MKTNIKNMFSESRSYSDIVFDCRSTVVRPSFDRRSTLLKMVAVLALIFAVGVGQMWGATYTAVASLTDGRSYILVAGDYAITANSSSTNWIDGTDVSSDISGSTLTTTATDIVWVAKKYTNGNNTTWSFKNGSSYIQNNSGNTYRNMTYGGTESKYSISSSKIYSTGATTKYLNYVSPSGFRMYNSNQGSYSFTFYELTESCTKSVAVSAGTNTQVSSMTFSSASVATCSSTAGDRQVTVTITPNTGYDVPTNLTLGGSVTPTKVSGPTGSGPYTYVYQFAQDANGTTTFGATCTAKTTTISFNQNGGDGGQTSSKTATYGQAMPTPITTPTRTHYTFGGYYDGSGGTGTQYYTNTGASARNWDKTSSTATLYANWAENLLTNYRTSCNTSCDDQYSFHYGPHTGDWETPLCFTKVGEHDWNITNFTIPSHTNGEFYVGYEGSNNGQSVTKAWTDALADLGSGVMNGAMVLLPTNGSIVGQAMGAKGTLVIWDNTSSKNQYVGFKPDGYAITYGGNSYAFTETATANKWETDMVTLPNVSSTTYTMGLATGTAGTYVTCAHSSAAENINVMGKSSIEGGLRKIWLYSTADNWIGSNAKMAIWDATNSHWGNNTSDTKFMTKVNNNLWYGYVPTSAESIILVRVNPSNSDPAWDWGQSYDVTPSDVNNYITITGVYSNSKFEYTIGSTHPTTGEKGKFRMWANSNDQNWYVHFVPYYVLTYDANGGSGAPAAVNKNSEEAGAVAISSTEPTYSGYRFMGWATSAERAAAGTVDYKYGTANDEVVLTGSLTLYAVWKQLYTVTYVYGESGSGSCSNGSYIQGETVTVCATDPTKAGCDFTGWSYSPSVTVTTGTFPMPASNVTITATWEDHNYTLTHAGTGTKTNTENKTTINSGDTPLTLHYTCTGTNAFPLNDVSISGGGKASWTRNTNFTWEVGSDKQTATLVITPATTITADVTITINMKTRYTVIWDRPGSSNDETEYYAADDNSVTMKTGEADCGTKKFYCWTETPGSLSPTPTAATSGTISGNKTYTAVYGDRSGGEGFEKVTAIQNGATYYIATGLTSGDQGCGGQNGNNSYADNVALSGATFNGSSVLTAFPSGVKAITVAVSGNYFSMHDGTNYLTLTTNGNYLEYTNSAAYVWELTASNYYIKTKDYSRWIMFNSNRFACYGNADNKSYAYLYKAAISWSNFAVACDLYDITIDAGITGGTVTTSPADETGSGQTVTVTATPSSCKYLSALSYNDGSDHDILSTRSFTMPAADVTVTATFSDKTVSSITPITDSHRTLMQGAQNTFVGEEIRLTYNNGETEDLAWDNATLTFSGYTMSSLGSQTVSVAYSGSCGTANTTYSITIVDGIPVTFWDAGETTVNKYDPGQTVPVESTVGRFNSTCSGWVFAGWSETKVDDNSTTFTPVYNFNASTPKTLYAVYSKEGSTWLSAFNLSEMRSGAKYVIVKNYSYGNDFALTNVVDGTYYLDGSALSPACETVKDAYNNNRYQLQVTPTASMIWVVKKKGTNWVIYNPEANKYLKLTSDGYAQLTTSCEDEFTLSNGYNDSEIDALSSSGKYLSWRNSSPGYFNGYTSGSQWYLTNNEQFSSTPPCAPRSVEFHGNGGQITEYGESTDENDPLDLTITEASRDAGIRLPSARFADCNGKSWTFVGWSDEEIDVTRIPVLTTDLANDGVAGAAHSITTDDEEYWAVFTNQGNPETKYGTISFTKDDVNTTYSSSEATTTKTVSAMGDYIFGYVNVGHQANTGIQFEENAGELYNKTSLGKVNSISFTTFSSGDINKLNVYVGNEEKTTDHLLTAEELQNVGSTWTYYPTADESYVYITNIGKGNGSFVCVGNISIDFGKGTKVWATTPDCSVITLSGTPRITSTATKTVKGVTPLTVNARQLKASTALTFKAYNVSDDTENSHFAIVGTVNANGSGTISNQTVVVTYTPAADADEDGIEEVYFKATALAEDNATTTISNQQAAYGRHLPAKFVIATKVGGDWYALPNNVTTASYGTRDLIPITVDNTTTPTTATVYSSTTDYLAWGMNAAGTSTDRYTTDGEKISFVSAINSKGLAGNASGLRNSAALPATTSGDYLLFDWKPSTTDLGNYTLQNGSVTTYYVATNGSDQWTTATTGADVRFLIYDKQPAPTITWQNNMLEAVHTTNKAENGIVTLPTGADPVSCNTTLYPTFCGWSASEPGGSYWTSAPSYITNGTVATENTTYYAVFKDATRNRWYTQCPTYYTLTFNRGTGSGTENYVVYTENTTYTMPDAATTGMSKEGYTLSGWTTTTSLTVSGNTVAAGGVIPVGASVSGIGTDLTFTAVWTGNITITGNVWLTSYNGVAVYTTSTTSNLITVSSADATGATRFKIIYLDGNGDEVAKGSSRFRLCNDGSVNYNMVDASSDYVSVSAGAYSQTYSICYTPNAHNTINNGSLKLQLMHNSTVLSEATLALHGRALPQEFVVASKFDGEWYAIPNTLEATEAEATAVAGIRITVDNTTIPTKAVYAPNTVVYRGEDRYTASHKYAIRLTDGTKHLQVSTTNNVNKMWLSSSGSEKCQDWWLQSTDFGFYTVTIPANTGNESKKIGMDGGNIGYYASPTSPSEKIYFLPIENELVDNEAKVTEWGRKSVILDVDAQTASSARARLGAGEPETVASFGQTLTSVNSLASKYNYTLSFSTLDFSAHKGELLYIDWLDESSDVISTSAVTIPWIIATNSVMGTIDNVQSHWKDWEVHVLPGVTLEADGNSFSAASNTAKIRTLEIYPGATVKVTSGTLNVTDLVLRYGWTRASGKSYDVAQLQIKRGEGGANLTTSHAYAEWYIDYDQYYPIAVPWNVTVANITYKNSKSAASAGMKLRYYDGASRAENGQTGVDEGANWKEYSPLPATLEPSKGYALTAKRPSGKAFSILRMPLTIPSSAWTALGEQGEVSSVHKNQVSVTGYGLGSSEWYAMGWNFIGNPYMSTFNGDDSGISGKLELQNGGTIRYATIPDLEFKNYYQVNITEANLKPASGFFVQANNADAQTITFEASKIVAPSAPARYAEKSETVPEQEAYIRLSNDDDIKDQMGLIIGDNYTSDYEPNADLVKVLGEANALKTYMRYINMDMAYVAINETLAKEWIPITVHIPSSGDYTFSLTNSSVVEHLEGVYLIDYKCGMITNLIGDTYSFYINEGVTSDRFAINAIVDKRETPTDVGNVDGMDSEHPLKFLYRDKLYILRNGVLYDATGKKVK